MTSRKAFFELELFRKYQGRINVETWYCWGDWKLLECVSEWNVRKKRFAERRPFGFSTESGGKCHLVHVLFAIRRFRKLQDNSSDHCIEEVMHKHQER